MLQNGVKVAEFKSVQYIGEGATGIVYYGSFNILNEATDELLIDVPDGQKTFRRGDPVAIKKFRAGKEKSFHLENNHWISSGNLYSFDASKRVQVREFFPGETLLTYLKRQTSLETIDRTLQVYKSFFEERLLRPNDVIVNVKLGSGPIDRSSFSIVGMSSTASGPGYAKLNQAVLDREFTYWLKAQLALFNPESRHPDVTSYRIQGDRRDYNIKRFVAQQGIRALGVLAKHAHYQEHANDYVSLLESHQLATPEIIEQYTSDLRLSTSALQLILTPFQDDRDSLLKEYRDMLMRWSLSFSNSLAQLQRARNGVLALVTPMHPFSETQVEEYYWLLRNGNFLEEAASDPDKCCPQTIGTKSSQ